MPTEQRERQLAKRWPICPMVSCDADKGRRELSQQHLKAQPVGKVNFQIGWETTHYSNHKPSFVPFTRDGNVSDSGIPYGSFGCPNVN